MREIRTSGSMRGVGGNLHFYSTYPVKFLIKAKRLSIGNVINILYFYPIFLS